MEKSRKYYAKAMDFYNDGYLDKSMEFCEKSLSANRANSPTLNLKGLIYYVKGDLESARNQWKMNYRMNNDEVARKYLDDSKNDRESVYKFKEVNKLIKAIRPQEALKLLEQLKASDFNSVNLNNLMANCYIKLGEYEKSYYYILKTIEIDKHNKIAEEMIKSLEDIGAIKHKKNVNKKAIASIICIVVIVSLGCIIGVNKDKIITSFKNVTNLKKQSEKDVKKEEEKITTEEVKEDKETEQQEQEAKPKEEVKEKSTFSIEKVKSYIDSKNYEELLKVIEEYKNEQLGINEKQMYINAYNLVKEDAIGIYYDKAQEYIGKKEYKRAVDELTKIYNISDGNYLEEHIIYMLGVCYEEQHDIVTSLKYYEAYVNKFSSGSYTEGVLYKLAVLNENIDLGKAKGYAEKLNNDFPESQYNNSNIQQILSK